MCYNIPDKWTIMFIDKYKTKIKKKNFFILMLLVILGAIVVCISVEWQTMLVIWMLGLIIFVIRTLSALSVQKDIGKIVELTNADYNDGTIIYSGKIVDIMYYKPYKRVCTIVDTRGFVNSATSENRGNTIVLFNRYYGDKLTGNRVVNVLVPKNDVIISDEKECLVYSDFFVFCDLKYKK